MDFSSLLSGLAEEVKRKPNKKPDVLPLPSEQAIGEVVGGAEQELAAQASEPSQGAPMQGSPLGLGEQQLRATEQGIADEPANADNVYQTVDTSKVDKLARVEGANRPDMSSLIPYQRDEQGYAIRPEGVDPQASIRRGDGSASDWSWAGQDSVRNYSGKPAVGTNGRVADDPTVGTATSGTDPRDTGSNKSGNTWKSHAETTEEALGESPLDKAVRQAEENYLAKLNAPIEKQSFWKDFGAKLIQGADAFFNGNRAPIQGWGRLKHDQAIQNANAKLNPLLAQRKQEQEFAYNDTRRQNLIDDNIQKRNELLLKQQIADNKEANAKAILADKKLGRELQATQIQDLKEYRNALIANGTRMTDARIKQIDERLADYDLDREQRNRVNDTNRDKGRPKNNVPLPPTPSQQLTPEQGSAVLKAISKMPPAQQAQAKANFYKQNPHLAK